ncbi:MAG: hypothetical protein ACKV1O_19960 [Saprospiraceae bacterium]
MKKTTAFLILALSAFTAFSQESEFENHANGLIYSDTTVKQLKYIVDSLNLKFRVCELDKVYRAKSQAKVHFVRLDTGDIKAAKADMEAGMAYEEFIQKHNQATAVKDLLVVKFKYRDYEDRELVELSTVGFDGKYEYRLEFYENLQDYDKPLKGKWVCHYFSNSEDALEIVSAFYFTEDFSQRPLVEKYARMVQYSDCMVDTSTQVFYESKTEWEDVYTRTQGPELAKFTDYVKKATNCPEVPENSKKKDWRKYWKKNQLWESQKISKIDSLRKKEDRFDALLSNAVKEVLENGTSDDEFEEYVELYYSPKTALELKRNRRVVGGCSQDDRPRVHALNIAKLSAETTSWELFLRAHLDIMNDRFDRVTDGSYAWAGRKTYIRELEVLDINVQDLLLGISLRIENPSNNHYFGSIGRIGRALTESEKAAEIEAKMLEMISDQELDDYNRILMYYLFLNYTYHREGGKMQDSSKEKLSAAVKTLPEYLASKITLK